MNKDMTKGWESELQNARWLSFFQTQIYTDLRLCGALAGGWRRAPKSICSAGIIDGIDGINRML